MTRLRRATRQTFRSLRHRNFRLYFGAMSVSFVGTWLQLIAQALLVLDLTGSGTALGLVTAAQFGPMLVLGAWAGVLVDRFDTRQIVQVSTSLMAVAASALGILVLTGNATLWWVYVLAGLLGLANAFDNPARRSLVNELVPDEEIANAVSLNSTLATIARLFGPALAGLLVSTVGIGWCFVLNGVSFLGPVLAVRAMDSATMRTPPPVRRERGQLRAGLVHAWRMLDLRVPLLLLLVVGTLGFNAQVLYPLLATRELAGDETTYTWLTAAGGLGMLLGSLWLARRTTIDTRLVGIAAVGFGVADTLLAVAPNVPFALVASFLVGVAAVGVFSGSNSVLQLAASPAMRGRVLALYSVVLLGSKPVGGPILGSVAEHAGTRLALGIGAAAALLAGLATLGFLRGGGLAGQREPTVRSSVALGADGTTAAA
jgi:MFS family permease